MMVAVIVSLLIGLAAAGLGVWDLHKINKITGAQAAAVQNFVPATAMISPTSGQTLSGVVSLDTLPVNGHVTSVQFIATGGSAHGVLLANGQGTIGGFAARWNSANLPNGTYQIRSVGYNTNGRSQKSVAVKVRIKNP
jgi:hypothetical protein